jgi:hypothetical protein
MPVQPKEIPLCTVLKVDQDLHDVTFWTPTELVIVGTNVTLSNVRLMDNAGVYPGMVFYRSQILASNCWVMNCRVMIEVFDHSRLDLWGGGADIAGGPRVESVKLPVKEAEDPDTITGSNGIVVTNARMFSNLKMVLTNTPKGVFLVPKKPERDPLLDGIDKVAKQCYVRGYQDGGWNALAWAIEYGTTNVGPEFQEYLYTNSLRECETIMGNQ